MIGFEPITFCLQSKHSTFEKQPQSKKLSTIVIVRNIAKSVFRLAYKKQDHPELESI